MTFFQRIRTPFTEPPAEEQGRHQARTRLIGEFLRERREDLGLDLDEIGAMLRIKPAYLAALEQGRSHDLPGPTYAIGFVRAYADFLGLDTEQVLARFKSEAAGITARPDLALPVPLGERSLPGGALVLAALILALCGYGIWYYLSTEERSRPERVAAVPTSLQPPAAGPVLVPPPLPRGAEPAAAANAPAPQPASPSPLFGAAISPANPEPAATRPPAASPAPPTQTTPAATASAGPQTAAMPASNPAAVTTAAAQQRPAATAPTALQPAAVSAAVPPPATAAAPRPPVTPAPGTVSSSAAPQTASASAAPSPTAKITIRALNDCWIQIRAQDQSIVFSRVLKSGEVYAVPARGGLSLRTGNAGALEVTVDGKAVPSIGGIGALRKDVALDPAELAAGTAVH